MIDTTEKPKNPGYNDSAGQGAELAEQMRNRLEEKKTASQDGLGSTLESKMDLDHYRIVRYYRSGDMEVIEEGLTLGKAQEHCISPDSRESCVWFDGYEIE